MLCPKCGQIMGEMICGSCGYDGSRDYLRFPTLFHDIPEAAEKPASAEQALAQKAQYDAASSLEEAADSPETFKAAALLFEQLARQGYRDSAERARKCREKAEELQAAKPSNDPEPVPPEKNPEVIPEQHGGKKEKEKKGLLAVVLGLAAVAVLALIIWKLAVPGTGPQPQASPDNVGVSLSATAAPSSAPAVTATPKPTQEPTTELASDFSYTLNNDGTATISKYNGTESVLYIPSSIDGHSVTSIGNSAFNGCSGLSSASIPDSVTSIGNWAFSGCSGLTRVTIPNSVTSIEDSAFRNCRWLKNVYYGGAKAQWEAVSIGSYNDYLTNATIHFNSAVTLVPTPEPTSETISASANDFSYTVNSNLTVSITEYNGTESSLSIPSFIDGRSVTSIGNSAFNGCSGLSSVSIPDRVTSIGNWAFSGCSRLSSVTIPNSVTSIGNSAFRNCRCLKDVYYSGTEEEWEAVTIGSYNDSLTNATIHFNS